MTLVNGSRRRTLALAALVAVVVLLGMLYWLHARRFDSTDDGYVGANVVRIAAQVSGPVRRLAVSENQAVPAGALLFEIDPTAFRLRVLQARAELAGTEGSLVTARQQLAAARAHALEAEVTAANAHRTLIRTARLARRHFLSTQALDNARTADATARAAAVLARAQLRQADLALGKQGIPARVQVAKAALAAAELDLAHTEVRSPAAGIIDQLSLRPGSLVTANTPLFALVEDHAFWVDANFKETAIADLRPGQPAEVDVDMYPHHPFKGRVASVAGASGTAFSLLPPENATGNWVKVTQRIPVRVQILDPDPRYPLRVGATASVTVRILR